MKIIHDTLTAEAMLTEETIGLLEVLSANGAVVSRELFCFKTDFAFIVEPHNSSLDIDCVSL